MVRKQKKGNTTTQTSTPSVLESIKTGFGIVSDVLFSNVFSRINSEADVLLDKVEHKAVVIEERIARRLTAQALFGLGGLFLIFSGFFYMTEYKGLSKTLAFLIAGGIVLLIAFIIRYRQLLNERTQ